MIAFLEWVTSSAAAFLTTLGGLGAAFGGSGVRWVQEGDLALVERFGKVIRKKNGEPRVIKPGFAWIIPGVDKLRKAHARQDLYKLPLQTITLSDKTIFMVGAVLWCRLLPTPQDLYNAIIVTEDLDEALREAGLAVVRDVLVPLKYENLLGERGEISDQLAIGMTAVASGWGVEVLSFKLTNTDPDGPTAQLIQMQAATAAKLEAAKVVAGELHCEIQDVPPVWVAAVGGVQSFATVSDGAKPA